MFRVSRGTVPFAGIARHDREIILLTVFGYVQTARLIGGQVTPYGLYLINMKVAEGICCLLNGETTPLLLVRVRSSEAAGTLSFGVDAVDTTTNENLEIGIEFTRLADVGAMEWVRHALSH